MRFSEIRTVTEPIVGRELLGPRPEPSPPTEGTTLLGRYRLGELIGEGGTSFVYAARDIEGARRVAVKVLRPKYLDHEQVVERFLREAEAAKRVRDPHVIEILDFGTAAPGEIFTVMERLDGETLASTLERDGALPWPRVRHLAVQLCTALAAAHRAGIVHRDVTLANVFRVRGGTDPDFVKLVDFGIARLVRSEEGEAPRLTSEVDVFGTPAFMAPEQVLRTCDADPRSDVYAVGVVMFALLTDRVPFEGKSATHVMQQQVHVPAPSPRAFVPGIPVEAEAVVLRALAKDPDQRFQTAEDLARAIESVRGGEPRTSVAAPLRGSRLWPLALAAATLALALVVAFA
jgi:eukaryotic-like serine/threonine-protein kinase